MKFFLMLDLRLIFEKYHSVSSVAQDRNIEIVFDALHIARAYLVNTADI